MPSGESRTCVGVSAGTSSVATVAAVGIGGAERGAVARQPVQPAELVRGHERPVVGRRGPLVALLAVGERALVAAVAVHAQDVRLDAEDDRVGARGGREQAQPEQRDDGEKTQTHGAADATPPTALGSPNKS